MPTTAATKSELQNKCEGFGVEIFVVRRNRECADNDYKNAD
jgi:hypothetical protein